ncbi:hypothetical protein D7S86_01420 [Pararobbsia silviterrae]|uniref:Uncharacterized protein n=1 Tax=Pararobbsia silviterrae TaxID=1792498 RepID=A0A494Y7F8_9BURK|nr:hypothetical protein D7S86_01420 [Pararobbsia silviterrae]
MIDGNRKDASEQTGGATMAWGEYLSADHICGLRTRLLEMAHELAELEGWPDELVDAVAYEMAAGPVGDIFPNLRHFGERLRVARVDAAKRAFLNHPAWDRNERDDRRPR